MGHFSRHPLPSADNAAVSRLKQFSQLLAGMTFLLILFGGLVTSHEAGLAVPDWPTSYGGWFPPMVGNVFWEHGHRMIAGCVGVLTLVLACAIQRIEDRPWLKRLGWIALGAVALQAILGGLTVIYFLPAPVSVAHAMLAQTFFCLTVAIAYFLNVRRAPEIVSSDREVLGPLWMTEGLMFAQLVLGSILRHSRLPYIIGVHILTAFLVLTLALTVTVRLARYADARPALVRLGMLFGVFVVLQFFLGMGSFIFTRVLEHAYAPSTAQVIFTAAHQTMGALLLALGLLLLLMVTA